MLFLLELKEKIKTIYNKYNLFIIPVARFFVALIAMLLINMNVGYMAKLDNVVVVLAVAVVCAILPNGATILILSAVLVLHLYALVPELALVALAVFVLMYLLYFRFTPKSSYLLIITAIMCAIKIPYVVPVAAALMSGAVSMIPTCFGVIVYYLIENGAKYEVALTSQGSQAITFTMGSIVNNRAMIITLVAFVATITLVHLVKKLSIDYSWFYAIGLGALLQFIIMIVGKLLLKADIDVVFLVIGTLLAVVLGYVLQVVFFNLDYKRTEIVQYEDDDYYYYVKAVPKVTLAGSDVKVKKINTRRSSKTVQIKSSKPVEPAKAAKPEDDFDIEFIHSMDEE